MKRYPQNGDWRLPSLEELLTLVDYKLITPATELPNMRPSYYWSSTTDIDYANYVWNIHFYDGYDYSSNKYLSRYVRAVRGEMK